MIDTHDIEATVTLAEAKRILAATADAHSVLLLSAPGVGKSAIVEEAAAEAGLACRSLLGTQLAPEDVSGVPRIEDDRTIFCPPRAVLPTDGKPFCLFLDELPACAPDVQKSFYSLLLERRIGEHKLPPGTWVVAAGNRAQDRALTRSISSALRNRLFVLQVEPSVSEWQDWAARAGLRDEIRGYIAHRPDALLREVPMEPEPFSTPRAWASLAGALDRLDAAGVTSGRVRRAMVHGRVSLEDAEGLCALWDEDVWIPPDPSVYLDAPQRLPAGGQARWLALDGLSEATVQGGLKPLRAAARALLSKLTPEEQMTLSSADPELWPIDDAWCEDTLAG